MKKQKVVILISGRPGTGKSTFAAIVERFINNNTDMLVENRDDGRMASNIRDASFGKLVDRVDILNEHGIEVEIKTKQTRREVVTRDQVQAALAAIEELQKFRLIVSGYGAGSESNLPAWDKAIETLCKTI